MRDERILCAGFGGQGVMSLGQILAYGGMLENLQVSWLPSYGPEMRGGTAYCSVMISEKPIGSPVIAGDATCAIIMNRPSFLKFESSVVSGGILLLNSSLVKDEKGRSDITVYRLPAVDLALESGNDRAANMVMLGAYLTLVPFISLENLQHAFEKVFEDKASVLEEVNGLAMGSGRKYLQEIYGIREAA